MNEVEMLEGITRRTIRRDIHNTVEWNVDRADRPSYISVPTSPYDTMPMLDRLPTFESFPSTKLRVINEVVSATSKEELLRISRSV